MEKGETYDSKIVLYHTQISEIFLAILNPHWKPYFLKIEIRGIMDFSWNFL